MLPQIACLALSTISWSLAQDDKGSYGDDRMQAREAIPVTVQTAPLLKAVDAGVIVVLSSTVLSYGPAPEVAVENPPLCTRTGLVQPGEMALPLPSCSGMLITPTRILTAAHCLNVLTKRSKQAPSVVAATPLFSVIMGHHTPLTKIEPGGSAFISGAIRPVKNVLYCVDDPNSDLAVLELDVSGIYGPIPSAFEPVPWRNSLPMIGEEAHLVSSPVGLPIKLSSCAGISYKCESATIKRVGTSLFWATLDSHKGSSGGGAIDSAGELFGIYSGGLPHESGTDCYDNIPYSDECPGDVLSLIDKLPPELFDDTKAVAPVSCKIGEDIAYPNQCHIRTAVDISTK